MAFPNQAARNQYLKTQVETASKEQLVVMLFDGIIRFTEQARKAIEEKAIEASHNALMRAQAIVMELIVTVDKDKGGDVAKNLMALHAYSFNCLVQCNLHKDVSKIDEVQKIYRNLREGWVAAMDSLGIAPNSVRTATGAPAQPQAAAPANPAAKAPIGQPGKPPVPPTGGKPLPTGTMKPSSPAAARPLPSAGTIAPQKPSGIIAAAKPQAAPAATPKPMPATGYGVGRTAMIGAAYGAKPAPAAPATPAPAAPQAQVPAPTVTTPGNPKQAAMLGAYQNRARNIA